MEKSLCKVTDDIRHVLGERILVLDGAMGTMLQRHGLEEKDFRNEALKNHEKLLKGNNDILSITRPNLVKEVHRQYYQAGADMVETNTFSSTSIAQADYGLEDWVYEMNCQAARLAKEVAEEFSAKEPEKPRFVAGALGPTNQTASISPDVSDPSLRAVTFEDLRTAYKQQTEALIDGGVDVLLVETIFDTLNAKAALFAIGEVKEERSIEVPVMVSATLADASGRTLSGQTPEAFLVSVSHVDLLSVGFNCGLGASQLAPYLKTLSALATCHVSIYPNAGLPNEFGHYDQTPKQMASQMEEFLERQYVNIVGGCCGTTPEHIHALSVRVKNFEPRKVSVIEG